MKFSNPFRFWPERIYSVPTLRGLFPLFITMAAGYFSFFRGSGPHQWLVITMSFFTVIHLLESSKTMRSLRISPDPDATIFAGVPSKVKLIATPQNSISPLTVDAEFSRPGIFSYPAKRVDLFAPSGLFRYWRYFEFNEQAVVLPNPRDHGVAPGFDLSGSTGDPDELHPIRDPRLIALRDEKIFQKTGKSLLRARSQSDERPLWKLDWDALRHLSEKEACEQISFWIREIERSPTKATFLAFVEVPFFMGTEIRSLQELRQFKTCLAKFAGDHHVS
ncbi:MAG: hypothetical protein KGP28_00875 [Bdellovibrionales bacterium]|nr:hypothetical protein [Bdellovibrionales bacterium]